MRTTSTARAALLLSALALVGALPGCKPMNPRPAVAPPPQEFRAHVLVEFFRVDEQAVEIEGDGRDAG
jgi:hypothetical protein